VSGEEDAVAWPLGVERKAVVSRADLDDALAAAMPGQRLGREARHRRRNRFGRPRRLQVRVRAQQAVGAV